MSEFLNNAMRNFVETGSNTPNAGQASQPSNPTMLSNYVSSQAQQFVNNPQAYQQTLNVRKSNNLSYGTMLGKIYDMFEYNPSQAQEMYNTLKIAQNDPGSMFYRQYAQPTNNAISHLQQLGFDTNQLTDDWFKGEGGQFIQQNLIYNGTSNTPTKPGKKASQAQNIAYWLYQYDKSESQTKAAESEYQKAMNEAYYWAQRTDRNYSDEEIIGKVRENFASKYPTLAKMEANGTMAPLEMNRAIDFSDDALYGAIYMGRNPDFNGTMEQAMAFNALGRGNKWELNQEIADKLDPNSATFDGGYSLGCTNLDDAALYFGMRSFPKQWVIDNQQLAFSADDTERSMYMKVRSGYENQVKAEEEAKELYEFIDRKLNYLSDPEKIMEKIDWKKYPTLAKMDASIGQNGNIMTGDMVALTEGVNYRYDNLKEQVVALCTKKAAAGDCNDYITYITSASSIAEGEPSIVTEDIDGKGSKWHPTYKPTEEQIQVAKANDKEIAESAELTETASTPAEKAVSEKQLSSMYETTKDYLVQMKEGGEQVVKSLAPTAVKGSIYGYSKSVLSGFDTISDYEQRSKAIETLETRKAELSDKLGDLIYAGKNYGENEVVPVTINGKTYDLTLSWNPNYAQGEYDEETGERERIGSYQAVNVSEAGSKGEMPVAEWDEDAVKEAIDKANSGKSSSDKMHNAAITEEQQAEIAEYWKIDSNLESSRIRQQELQADYDKAKKAIDDAKTVQNMTISLMKEAGLDTKQMEDAAVVTDFFLNFTKYDPTEWSSYNLYHNLSSELISGNTNTEEMFKTAETGDKEILQAIDVAKTMLEYADENGIVVPDNVRENIQRYIDSLEAQHQDFEYMSLIRNEDFKSEAEEGRKLWSEMNQFDDKAFAETGTLESQPSWNLLTEEQRQHLTYLMEQANSFENPMGIDIGTVIEEYNGYLDGLNIENRLFGGIPATTTLGEIMTDYELDTFYYLLQKGGLEQANAYADHLTEGNGVLNSRLRERTEENAKALADKGLFGRRAANVLSMLLSPIQAAQSLTYTIGYGIRKSRGERVEWNPNSADLSANIYKKSAREEIQNEIARTYENPVLRKVMSGLQEIISNRGDSIVNGFVFGNFFNGIANQYLQEFLSAVPMAVSAATDAVSEAKEKGASDTQLLGIYATTLLFEAGTEAVSLDNIRESLNLGKDLTVDGLKDWAKNWLTKSGISEMIGETITEAVEQAADTYFLGENSDYAKAVKKYQEEEGMSEEEAIRQASLDQVSNLLHTALISYLSPGMDVASYAAGRYSGYRSEARYLQEHGENVSVLDVYRDYKQNRENTEKQSKIQKEIEEIERNNTNPNMEEASEQEAGVAVPEAEQETITPEQKAAQDLTIDYEILETAIGKDPSSQTASVASVLDTQRTDESSDMANAAAANISNLFGDTTPAEGMQTLIIGAHAAGVDASVVKQAIQTAALSENSAAYNMIQSEEFRNADPGKKAQLLASTVEADANNANVQGQVTKSIYENRVARAEKTVINLPEVKKKNTAVYEAQGFLLKAQETTQMAQKNLESVQMEQEAMVGDVMTAGEQHFQDPLDHAKADMFDSKMRELDRHDKVVQEYRQSLEKAQNDEKSAQSKVDRAVEDYANEKRKAAQQIVNEQDQQRAGAKVQAQAEAEQQAVQEEKQRVQQEATDNANIADVEGFLDLVRKENPNITKEDEQKIREKFAEAQKRRSQQTPVEDERGADGKLTQRAKDARNKAVEFVNRKFGLPVVLADDITEEDANGVYSEGFYDEENHRIVLNNDLSFNEVMTRVLPHELLHSMEKAGTYNSVVNSLLGVFYGNNSDFEQAVKNLEKNNGKPSSRFEQDILYYKGRYEKALKGKRSYRYAAQETVAHRMGDLFYNPDNPQRSQEMINRLAADNPNAAKKIMNSLKSMVKKALGMKGAWLSNTQKTIDLFEKALSEKLKSTNKPTTRSEKLKLLNDIRNQKVEYESGSYKIETIPSIFTQLFDVGDLDLAIAPRHAYNIMATVEEAKKEGMYRKNQGDHYHGLGPDGFMEAIDALDNPAIIMDGRSKLGTKPDPKIAMVVNTETNGPLLAVIEFYKEQQVVNGDGRRTHALLTVYGKDGLDQYVQTASNDGRILYVDEKQGNFGTAIQSGSNQSNPAFNQNLAQFNKYVKQWKDNRGIKYSIPEENNTIVADDEGDPLATELPGGTVVLDTGTKYSLSSFTPEEQDKVRSALIDSGRFSVEDVDKYLGDTLSIASIVAADRDRLDFTADPEKTMLKPNAEYVKTLDASTLCAKRLLYQGTFNEIQHALPNTPLMPEDLIDLSNMMRDMGYETPCGICYVESRRRQLGKFTEQWLESYDGEYKPTIDEVTTSDGLEKLRKEHPQAYQDFINAMNKKGTMNPKVVQLRTDYKGEIRSMTPAQIQKVKDIGGLRVQSFSDFETPHLLDMAQAVMDMSAKGLTAQAYTKMPNFPWAFGDTGIKINLSLIGKGTGVDAQGNLIFDDVEGMPFDEAMKLRDRYSKNVGTILVGINDEHIKAAMADPRIDFIIPFHKSGWSKEELNKMPVLNGYSDYTDSQNEKAIVGKNKNGTYKTESLEKTKRVNFQPVGENGYWDFTKTGKENAEIYLKMCAKDKRLPKFSQFLVDNGDGSFSLQPDGSTDGYWKTLIDFKMYDNDGVGSPQQEVTPNINMPEATRILNEYSLERNGISRESNNDLPVAQPVVERFVEEYKASHPLDENRVRYSLHSDAPYLSAVDHGDMETAQAEVNNTAEQNMPDSVIRDSDGKLLTVYHGTSEQFNVFDMSKGRSTMDIQGSFFSPYELDASGYGENVGKYYLNITNPAPEDVAYSALRRFQGQNEAGNKAKEYLISQGYDGAVYGVNGEFDEIIAFYPEQIKSADPVTYDDNGNVIPLSERFNDQKEDIRYSLPSDDILDRQIEEYLNNGGILWQTAQAEPQGAHSNPNMGYRQWGNEGAQQSDELVEEAKQRVLNSEYTKDTNAAELDRAIDWIRSNKRYADDDGFQESMRKVMSKGFNYQSKDGQARMVAVMALAVARKDTYAQVQLAEAYNEQGTALGQALQARKLFRLMTPAGRVATLQRMLSKVQDQLDAKNIQKTITLSDWIIQAASEATDERQFARIQKAAAAELAEQIPANWKDKLRGLRMLSMLGNPRTHVRNFIGNMLFVPAVGLKNKMGALIELGQEQGKRTKTTKLFLSKEVRDFASQDAEFMKDDLTGESKYNEGNMVQREQKPFKGTMQKLIDFNSNALEWEDWKFLKGHYRRALGGWIEANGYTIDQLKSNPELLDQGRAYAINEAQKATYRDFNGLADRLNKLSRNPETTGQKVLGFAVDAVLPFKKTPANILKRGLEYSPVGLVRGLKNLAFDMKSGKITPTQVIDRICSGLAGSAILAMGAFLSAAGVVTCDLGDDKDKNEKEQGNQKYSIKLHLFGEDVTYTMDWAAPMSMPFFVGAAIQQQLAKKGDFDINAVMDSLGNIAEPVLNLSMLDGVNTLFKTSQYDDTDTITQIGAKVASNYITSYVPSFLGAITRSLADDRRRATFVKSGEGKGITGTFRYAWEQVENKLPGVSRTNIPVRDVFGNEETDSLAERIIENFISPGYISHYKNNPILKEMDRLYNANVTDSEDMVPKDPPKSFTYGDNKYVLSAEQWDQYKAVRGRTAYELLTDLINSDGYKSADNEAQIQMIKQCWEYAGKVGKASIVPEYRIDEASENPVEDVITEGKVTSYNTKMLDALAAGDYEGYETMVEALREAGVEDSKIKEKIRNRYIKKYKEAYIAADYHKMDEIEEILTYSGFDFDLDSWEEQVDKKRNQ